MEKKKYTLEEKGAAIKEIGNGCVGIGCLIILIPVFIIMLWFFIGIFL